MGIVAAISLLFVSAPLSGNRAVAYGGYGDYPSYGVYCSYADYKSCHTVTASTIRPERPNVRKPIFCFYMVIIMPKHCIYQLAFNR
jgi:hypothetical protein